MYCCLLQELRLYGFVDILEDRHAWVQTMLLAATRLTALSTSTETLPRSLVMQHLHLRHLELLISNETEERLQNYLTDISRCLTLESLTIRDIDFVLEDNSQTLPCMHLHTMPRLKHVTLEDCILVQALSLPANCSLFLEVNRDDDPPWHKHCRDFHGYTSVMQFKLTLDDADWPSEIQGFSALKFFECRIGDLFDQDLADLRHIPHVRVVSPDDLRRCDAELQLTGGSWQSLEVLIFGKLDLNINDVDSFVRDTRSFTFSSEKTREADVVFQKVLSACGRHGKACHMTDHKATWGSVKVTYVTLSTSKEVAEKIPIIDDDDHERGCATGLWGERTLCHWQDFWPCDPCASVKRA